MGFGHAFEHRYFGRATIRHAVFRSGSDGIAEFAGVFPGAASAGGAVIRIETATSRMFEQVYPLLQQFNLNNPDISREQWRFLFDYPWPSDEPGRGFILYDGERVVGFMGAIYFERP